MTLARDPRSDGTLQRLPTDRALRETASERVSTLSLVVARTGDVVGGWMVRAARFVRRLGRLVRRRLVGDG